MYGSGVEGPCRGLNYFDEKSAFRPCYRELVELFKSMGWPLFGQVGVFPECP